MERGRKACNDFLKDYKVGGIKMGRGTVYCGLIGDYIIEITIICIVTNHLY